MGRRSRIIVGLNSGTCADGVDAVACEVTGRGAAMRVRLLGHFQRAYPKTLRERLLALMAPAATRTEELCRLDAEIGERFAEVGAVLVDRLGLSRIDLVGSHGQTICHLPPGRPTAGRRRGGSIGCTQQIGDASRIAVRLGAPVVSGFRQADMAVGGQGAPLVPWTDYVLFRHPKKTRIVQNIGGIANLTWLPAGGGAADVVAFDTGPGNMVMDALVRRFTDGKASYDRNGRRAKRGRVNDAILECLLQDAFFELSPPRSCGREEFGERYVERILTRFRRADLSPDDWVATATALTAASIALAYAGILAARCGRHPPADEIILCGGGAKNPSLVHFLERYVTFDGACNIAIRTTADFGILLDAKEAVSFAMLAAACVDGVPANLPQVTGASRGVVLGQVCSPTPKGHS